MIVEIQGIKELKISELNFEAPPSKSYTHRAIIIASLSSGKSEIVNWLKCDDTYATLECCKNLGVNISEENKNLKIFGTKGYLKPLSLRLNCRNSGTTLRLITGLASLATDEIIITGYKSLINRPVGELASALKSLGVNIKTRNGYPPIKLRGKAKGGEISIRGDISSQFISSLLIIAPYLKNGLRLKILGDLVSKPYIDITIDTMKKFGVDVINNDYKIFEVQEGIYSSNTFKIEGDFSSSSYLLALAPLLKTKVRIRNLNPNSKQADKKILNILKEMGCKIFVKRDEICVEGNSLEGIELDLKDSPDLLPTVVALACRARGVTVIKNVKHARYKESDRLKTCYIEFKKFGVKIEEMEDGLKIYGAKETKGSIFYCHNDHRLAMAITILALASKGKSIIHQSECVEKSFPDFYKYLLKYFTNNIKIISL